MYFTHLWILIINKDEIWDEIMLSYISKTSAPTSTCGPQGLRTQRTRDPESRHIEQCLPHVLPPEVQGCHGDGGPSGTSGWNLGPCSLSHPSKKTYINEIDQKVYFLIIFLFFRH